MSRELAQKMVDRILEEFESEGDVSLGSMRLICQEALAAIFPAGRATHTDRMTAAQWKRANAARRAREAAERLASEAMREMEHAAEGMMLVDDFMAALRDGAEAWGPEGVRDVGPTPNLAVLKVAAADIRALDFEVSDPRHPVYFMSVPEGHGPPDESVDESTWVVSVKRPA